MAALCGCHEDPPIVIRFEPNDMSGSKIAAAPVQLDGAIAAPHLAEPVGAKKKAECKVKADCIVTPVDCCDCANGGKQQAIAKLTAVASKAARDKRCKGALCTQMFSTDPTCGKRADCQDGTCVLTP